MLSRKFWDLYMRASFFIVLLVLFILPFILPEFPTNYQKLFFYLPKLDELSIYVYILIAMAILDFVLLILIKEKGIFKFPEDIAIFLKSGLVNLIPIYGIGVELMIWLNIVTEGFLAFFIVLGCLAYGYNNFI